MVLFSRLTPTSRRLDTSKGWFPNYILVQSLFCSVKDLRTDVRRFLLRFNDGLGEKQLVFSLGAVSFQVRNTTQRYDVLNSYLL
jgi:hypothetical protein